MNKANNPVHIPSATPRTTHHLRTLALSLALVFTAVTGATFSTPTRAQSEASVALSMLPLASVVGVASVAAAGVGAISAAPLVLSAAGAVFTIRVVEVTARGTVYVLERASDGARVSVEVAASAAGAASLAVGTGVAVSVIGAGLVLSAAGEVIAFIPNAIGRALLHNERLTY